MLNIPKSIKSFKPALVGIKLAANQANMRVHILAMVGVIATGLILNINPGEWAVIAISISMVMAMEIINTAIEDIANTVRDTLKLDYQATRDARDLAAGAVLLSVIGAITVGLIVFIPKLVALT
jgi:diacylglycerol kinase